MPLRFAGDSGLSVTVVYATRRHTRLAPTLTTASRLVSLNEQPTRLGCSVSLCCAAQQRCSDATSLAKQLTCTAAVSLSSLLSSLRSPSRHSLWSSSPQCRPSARLVFRPPPRLSLCRCLSFCSPTHLRPRPHLRGGAGLVTISYTTSRSSMSPLSSHHRPPSDTQKTAPENGS